MISLNETRRLKLGVLNVISGWAKRMISLKRSLIRQLHVVHMFTTFSENGETADVVLMFTTFSAQQGGGRKPRRGGPTFCQNPKFRNLITTASGVLRVSTYLCRSVGVQSAVSWRCHGNGKGRRAWGTSVSSSVFGFLQVTFQTAVPTRKSYVHWHLVVGRRLACSGQEKYSGNLRFPRTVVSAGVWRWGRCSFSGTAFLFPLHHSWLAILTYFFCGWVESTWDASLLLTMALLQICVELTQAVGKVRTRNNPAESRRHRLEQNCSRLTHLCLLSLVIRNGGVVGVLRDILRFVVFSKTVLTQPRQW